MTSLHIETVSQTANPLDVLEALFTENEWPFERAGEDELVVETTGGWCDYRLYFAWRDDMHALHFSCAFDTRIPPEKRRAVHDLLAMINERLWMGHFDLSSQDATPMFRHAVPTRGARALSVEQLEDLMDIALAECERFYPAFQFVLWGGYAPEEAVAAALIDTQGEA